MTTANTNEDKLILGGHEFTSRFILGSGKFSLELVKACIEKAGTQIVTLALRRANEGGLANILDYIPKNVTLLPNTSGARNAEQAVRIMYAEEINTDKNKTALIAEKTAEYAEGQSSALAAAKRGYVDDIIEPDATRKRLIAAYEMLYGKKVTPVTKKHTAV